MSVGVGGRRRRLARAMTAVAVWLVTGGKTGPASRLPAVAAPPAPGRGGAVASRRVSGGTPAIPTGTGRTGNGAGRGGQIEVVGP